MMTQTVEIWKDVPLTNGLYQVSNMGGIKSKKYGNAKITKKLIPQEKIHGYLGVKILGKNKRLHRLVASAFLPTVAGKSYINHKNGIKNDNRVVNLEWCNNSENIRHAYKNNLLKHFTKPVLQFTLAGKLIGRFDSATDAAIEVGCNRTHISSCCTGKRNKCGGYIWKYDQQALEVIKGLVEPVKEEKK